MRILFKGTMVFALFFALGVGFSIPATSHALTTEELQTQIQKKQQEKAALDAENKKLQAQIDVANAQAKTLQGAVKALDTTAKKLQNDLKVTTNKIDTTKLTIQDLGIKISETEQTVEENKKAMEETLRSIHQIDNASLIQTLLQYKNINELWSAVESLHQFQTLVKQKTDELNSLNEKLQNQKSQNEDQNKSLVNLKSELSTKKTIVDQNKQAKNTLLVQTKNQESLYEKQLKANIEKGKQFEQELFQFESQLSIQLDKSKLPTKKSGALDWPVDSPVLTQRFGRTSDSGRLYVSGTHNGVDFRASVGTIVKSVGDGKVVGMGNTDDQSGCYSYGRWLLIEHTNGLSSLYAHLSAYRVTMGQNVSTGDVVAYSGGQPGMQGAGYSTGPHLHLGLFASQGVRVGKYTSSKFCKNVSIPIVEGLNAYLDPLAYLPAI